MKTLIILCGVPGSGKSTFAKNYFANANIISRDQIRFSMMGDNYFANEKLVFREFINRINKSLINNEITVVDGTHINNNSRGKLLKNLTIPDDCFIDCYCFEVPLDVCKARNKNRTGMEFVPESVIEDFYNRYTIPVYDYMFPYRYIYVVDEEGEVRLV